MNCYLNPSKIGTLLKAIKKFSDCTVIQFGDLEANYQVGKDIDAVIISGSKARIVNPSHRDVFKETVSLIKHIGLPMFSVCYGHQLLCWSLGATVASFAEPVKDKFEKVRIIEVDEIFAGFEKYQTIPLAQWHYDYVLKDSLNQADLVLLADSPSCEVEAVKHKHKPFYGVQFHPERINIKDESRLEGYKVIENFYKNVIKR